MPFAYQTAVRHQDTGTTLVPVKMAIERTASLVHVQIKVRSLFLCYCRSFTWDELYSRILEGLFSVNLSISLGLKFIGISVSFNRVTVSKDKTFESFVYTHTIIELIN